MRSNFIFLSTLFLSFNLIATAQFQWNQKANLPTTRLHSTGFSIGTKGYMGTGSPRFPYYNDLWEYTPAAGAPGTWAQKADFGGGSRAFAVGFSIGTKGYIGTGSPAVFGSSKDFWEWDQASDAWTKKNDLTSGAVTEAVGFSIGTKGYIGTGVNGTYSKSFWEWDQASNVWSQMADFAGYPRKEGVGFSIPSVGKGYIGLGIIDSLGWTNEKTNDFWEWDQATNTWTKKASYPGLGRFFAVGFTWGNKGMVGTGADKYGDPTADVWSYDPGNNTWTREKDYGGGPIRDGFGFSIGNFAYIGAGADDADKTTPQNAFWEYSDGTTPPPPCTFTVTAFSDPSTICAGGQVGIFASGGTSYSWNTGSTASHINDSPNVTTTYTVTGTNAAGCVGVATITIAVYNCTGVSEINSTSASAVVFPNPFSESAVVSVKGVEGNQSNEIKIFDVLGNEVRSQHFIGKQTAIERGALSDGIYFYKIQTPLSTSPSPLGEGFRVRSGEATGKFIITKQ